MGFHKLNRLSHDQCFGVDWALSRFHIDVYDFAFRRSESEFSSHELLTDSFKFNSAIRTMLLFIGVRYDFILTFDGHIQLADSVLILNERASFPQLQAHVNQCDKTPLEVIHDGRPAGN